MTTAIDPPLSSSSARQRSAFERAPPSNTWLGREIKAAAYDLYRATLKIVAIAAVVVAHQYTSLAFQLSFWAGCGYLCLVKEKPFNQERIATLSYGHCISWMIYATQGVAMCRTASTALATATGVGFVAWSIFLSLGSLWYGWQTR